MKGNVIIANGNEPVGRFTEGTISGSGCAPGMLMEEVPSTEPASGRMTYRKLQTGSAGDRRPLIVLLEDPLQGVAPDPNGANVYTSGARGFFYYPVPGDEINMMVKNLVGTADSHAIGDLLMGDIAGATGKLIVQAAAANWAPFQLEETSAALTADTLLCCRVV